MNVVLFVCNLILIENILILNNHFNKFKFILIIVITA